VGKGTVVAELVRRRADVHLALSATTRPPRPSELEGVHYRFLTEEQFTDLAERGGFLEWVEFNGRRYGTPWSAVRGPLAQGHVVVLEIEVQGARKVREAFPEAVLVFLTPPSEGELLERLRRRGDSEDTIRRRMAIARWEREQVGDFDHVVVNDDLDTAVDALARILDAMPAR
jgi:guanylate kinase